ncbi:hypothetical protein FPV67DRAFT_1117331 [Lyophyllum atratum]|nr:hypothetical protein FPV67DRAFT_1117331 [Lyophyllum atratum]
MLFKSGAFVSLLATTAAALPAAQAECVTCPATDLDGLALVAGSGGSMGTPRFCGYSADATGASGPQVTCFYGEACSPLLVPLVRQPLLLYRASCNYPRQRDRLNWVPPRSRAWLALHWRSRQEISSYSKLVPKE